LFVLTKSSSIFLTSTALGDTKANQTQATVEKQEIRSLEKNLRRWYNDITIKETNYKKSRGK